MIIILLYRHISNRFFFQIIFFISYLSNLHWRISSLSIIILDFFHFYFLRNLKNIWLVWPFIIIIKVHIVTILIHLVVASSEVTYSIVIIVLNLVLLFFFHLIIVLFNYFLLLFFTVITLIQIYFFYKHFWFKCCHWALMLISI